jgi:hypothetical protein
MNNRREGGGVVQQEIKVGGIKEKKLEGFDMIATQVQSIFPNNNSS